MALKAFSLEEAPCGPTSSVGGSTGFFTGPAGIRKYNPPDGNYKHFIKPINFDEPVKSRHN
jgi:hypothetical protein